MYIVKLLQNSLVEFCLQRLEEASQQLLHIGEP